MHIVERIDSLAHVFGSDGSFAIIGVQGAMYGNQLAILHQFTGEQRQG